MSVQHASDDALGWSGLSQRVLRHWEQIGLVTPSRTTAGHRRYGPTEITRLYRAMALRQAGLRLGQIVTLLDAQDPDPAATLRTPMTRSIRVNCS